MSDAAPPLEFAGLGGQSPRGPLTPERIERTLADFRDWLTIIPDPEPAPPAAPTVDLHTLIGQFIALRHEVNLQTKASRSALEQNAETLRKLDEAVESLGEPVEPPDDSEALKPLLKAVVDVYDALALALRQVERQKTAIHTGLDRVLKLGAMEPPPSVNAGSTARPGFWKRLWGATDPVVDTLLLQQWHTKIVQQAREREAHTREAVEFLKNALDGLITGYGMSLNRIDRILPQYELEKMECLGERFDPEVMEVVEVVAAGDRPAGEVVEEVRRGYHFRGAIFRYAQVKVAK